MSIYKIPLTIHIDRTYEFEAEDEQEAKKLAEAQAEKEYPEGEVTWIFEPYHKKEHA